MDLCNDWENPLSSEEYSDDDLINAAISPNKNFEASEIKPSSKLLNNVSPTKRNVMKSSYKMKKYAVVAKKRSVIC